MPEYETFNGHTTCLDCGSVINPRDTKLHDAFHAKLPGAEWEPTAWVQRTKPTVKPEDYDDPRTLTKTQRTALIQEAESRGYERAMGHGGTFSRVNREGEWEPMDPPTDLPDDHLVKRAWNNGFKTAMQSQATTSSNQREFRRGKLFGRKNLATEIHDLIKGDLRDE